MHHGNAFSIHTFFPYGDPAGLRVVKKDNWSGRAIAFRRDRMDEATKWQDLKGTGVYILRGEAGGEVRIYIGEADDIMRRLKDHVPEEFWIDAVAFVRRGDSLDKAEGGYLEARLIQIAESADRCILNNKQRPNPDDKLEDDKEASAEGFLEELLECLRALGIPEFEPEEKMPPATGDRDEERTGNGESADTGPEGAPCNQGDRILRVATRGVEAHGHHLPDCRRFEVSSGAMASKDEVPSLSGAAYKSSRDLRKRLIRERQLVEDEVRGVYVLQNDWIFTSPSQAEHVLAGRPGSGLLSWPLVDGDENSEEANIS